MSSDISHLFRHLFSSLDIDKPDDIVKQRKTLRDMLEIATSNLKNSQYKQAKEDFIESRNYLQNCQKRDEMNVCNELDFFISISICYSFSMSLDTTVDLTKEEFITEDKTIKKEINALTKQYSKRQFPLFLKLVYSFKKENWREAIYFCEVVRNFQLSEEEEKNYKSVPFISKDIIPELDLEYCKDVITNIEEAAIYGLVESVANLDQVKNSNNAFSGFNWVKLWSKEFNDKIIKRIRSYKKPMNSLQLHKLFHAEILPKFYNLNKDIEKPWFTYYKKEFMYQCEECLRAKLQQESRKELFERICNESDNDTDYSDDDYDDDYCDDDDDYDDEIIEASKDKASEKGKNDSDKKCHCSGNTEKGKTEKNQKMKLLKSQQTQTDKIKFGHKHVQTECSSRKKSIMIQTDAPKPKKPEKMEKVEKTEKPQDCNKCLSDANVVNALESIKNILSESKTEMKSVNGSIENQFAELLKKLKAENSNMKNQNNKNDKVSEMKILKDNIAKLEKQIVQVQETFDKENKALTEKNTFLQKLIIDQANDKYILHKNIYLRLEKNCKLMIENVSDIQSILTQTTIPSIKENHSYLNRWEKTFVDLQNKSIQLRCFYKKTKSQLLHSNRLEIDDWPEISDIPGEAYSFLFDNLKQHIEKSLSVGNEQNEKKSEIPSNLPYIQPQTLQNPVNQGNPFKTLPYNYTDSGLSIPSPLSMPETQNTTPWPQSSNQHKINELDLFKTFEPRLKNRTNSVSSDNSSLSHKVINSDYMKFFSNQNNIEQIFDGSQAQLENEGFWSLNAGNPNCDDNSRQAGSSHDSQATSLSRFSTLSSPALQTSRRPFTKIVNVNEEVDKTLDPVKELFKYLKSKCEDVDHEELVNNVIKVLKEYDGSLTTVSKTEILKKVKSSILASRQDVGISPRTPLVDWKTKHSDNQCSICFDDLMLRPKSILHCRHEFHKDCISKWLQKNSECPICRIHSVIDEDYPSLS